MKGNVALKIGSMTRDDVIYPTTQLYNQHCNLLQYQLTDLIYDGVRALIGNRPRIKGRFLSHQQQRQMTAGTGRRTIGQFAGHTIHLEIEEVTWIKKMGYLANPTH